MCRVNADAFPGSLNSNTDIVITMIVANGSDAVKKLTQSQSELSDSHSVNRTTLFSLSQTNITRITDKIMTVKCVTTIPCIDPADLSINISDQPTRTQNCLLGTMTCASRRKMPGCVPDVRVEVPRDLNTDVSVFD